MLENWIIYLCCCLSIKPVVNVISLFFSDKSVPIDGYQGNTNPILYQYSSYFYVLVICNIFERCDLEKKNIFIESFSIFFPRKMNFYFNKQWGKSHLSKNAVFVVDFLAVAQVLQMIVKVILWKFSDCSYHEHTKIYKMTLYLWIFF